MYTLRKPITLSKALLSYSKGLKPTELATLPFDPVSIKKCVGLCIVLALVV